ncbi:glycosyltransferase family 9 protein [Pectobacterium zantedeschiae]|uniref:Lipopolysaccharide heptosyltransferase family protein n=1 Tax=Pectobacterium zantedeschiae TaxID=2034769 RepID=A0A9X8JH96_9GAMM|nr:glycosyltransferase family 9 protein [Pectobacterium zantedeschiae]RYC39293.1 glycosyl transferase [Pectobacterium zantedeschiae]RYC39429.1 lipopolysaccharide heptosyltransferase family protein [Pectobacterium zantedeschiae]
MQRILVMRIDFLGDMVCTTALIRSLRTQWPIAEIHVLANQYNSAVLAGNPDVTDVYHYIYSKNRHRNPRSGLFFSLIDKFSLIMRLRRLKFDLMIIPNGGMNKNSIQFSRWLNIKDKRWHTKETEFDDRNIGHITQRPIIHEVISGYQLVPELGMPDIKKMNLYLYPNSELKMKWERIIKNKSKYNVGFFISNKCFSRQWPRNNWFQLAGELGDDFNIKIFCSPDDVFENDALELSPSCYIRPKTVPDLIAAMSHLDIVVSADSAPVHFGAALQIPVVSLFEARPEKYLRWYPIGVKNIVLYRGDRVDSIYVDDVKNAILTLGCSFKNSH